jgi:hypothetical protein
MNLKYLKRILTLVLVIIPFLCLQAESQYLFDLEAGKKYVYRITIDLSQKSDLTSSNALQSGGKKVIFGGAISMKYSLEVVENQDNDYARIVCCFDSLRADLKSRVDNIETKLSLEALKDNIRIRINDSLIAIHSPNTPVTDGAGDFYERLLFVGEDIVMLAYPDGEILNITENKNLWDQAMDFIGLADEGFLQIIFPQSIKPGGSGRWEQSSEIKKLGDFKLKTRPDPLVTNYSLKGGTDRAEIKFSGELKLGRFISETGVSDLDDQMTLEVVNLDLDKNGSAVFSSRRGVIEKLSYDTSLKGEFYLSGSGLEEYQSGMNLDFAATVTYTLSD